MKYILSFLFTLSCVLISFISLHPQPVPRDSLYLGQTPPGETPKLFLKGMTEGMSERIAITRDGKEIYFNDNTGLNNYTYSNSKWNGPCLLFRNCFAPALSPDGKMLYFQKNENNIIQSYYSVKNDTGWSTPLNFWVTPKHKHYLQVTNAGNYYLTTNPLVSVNGDISKLIIKGSDTTIQSLKQPINGYNGVDFFISRDESYIIFVMRRNFGKGLGDLNISYRKKDGSWTNPKNLGNSINSPTNWQWGPYISPDNKYLFFTSALEGRNPSIYWVKVDKLIDSLKYTNFVPYVKNSIPDQTAVKDLLFNYSIPDSIFIDDNGNNTLTYTAALSDGNPLPSWLSFNTATRTFSGVPNKIEVDSIKVTATDTAGASASVVFKMIVAVPSIDYFGQTPPGDSAIVFAPDFISLKGRFNQNSTFSAEGSEFFFTVSDSIWNSSRLWYSKFENNRWSIPQITSVVSGDVWDPVFTPDGKNLLYCNRGKICKLEKNINLWVNPVELDSVINPSIPEWCPSATLDNTIYFYSRPNHCIYLAREIEGHFNHIEKVQSPINDYDDREPFIAPDESYMIFISNNRPDCFGQSDLYISYKTNKGWTAPKNLGPKINSSEIESSPKITPDKKYLLFTRREQWKTNKPSMIYWVSAKFINDFKKEAYNPIITK